MRSVRVLTVLVLWASTVLWAGGTQEIVFEKKSIKVGSTEVRAEIADTAEKSARGLMFRHHLADGEGMLFIFPSAEVRSFWMKNTFIDLSIGFFDSKRKLIDIQDMKAVSSEMDARPGTYESAGPAQYALEVPKGWFQKHKVKLGDRLTGL